MHEQATSQSPILVQIITGCPIIQRHDLRNKNEEADQILVFLSLYASKVENNTVSVVADDTVIYLVLLYHSHTINAMGSIYLLSTRNKDL